MSIGSNPVTTIGTLYLAAIGSYSVQPMMVQTCPAARNPCTRFSGAPRIAVMAGGTVTCETRMVKFVIPSCLARHTAIAFAGAVVSKPTAKNTTCLSGCLRAKSSASSGEYTTRTFPPLARMWNRSHSLPGTRSMSPKELKITSGRAASASALSICSSGVTHTGQPGPWIISTAPPISSSSPCFTIVCVCPPHTSISTQRRVAVARICSITPRATAPSRYSVRYFIRSPLPRDRQPP